MITIPTPPSGTFGEFKPKTPKEKSYLSYLVIAAAILIIGSGYYFFFYKDFGLSFKEPSLQAAAPLNDLENKVIKLKTFPFSVIDNPLYKSLKTYGAVPVTADSLGRLNPFVPY